MHVTKRHSERVALFVMPKACNMSRAVFHKKINGFQHDSFYGTVQLLVPEIYQYVKVASFQESKEISGCVTSVFMTHHTIENTNHIAQVTLKSLSCWTMQNF